MYKYKRISRYILNEVEISQHLISCLEYFFFSIDSSEARKQYGEYCLSIMQTITYAHDIVHFQGTLIFRMHNSDPTPQGINCVLTALHVNCMILFDKVL
jgi:hypothetical protein